MYVYIGSRTITKKIPQKNTKNQNKNTTNKNQLLLNQLILMNMGNFRGGGGGNCPQRSGCPREGRG